MTDPQEATSEEAQKQELNFEDDAHMVTADDFVRYPRQARRQLWEPLTSPRSIRLLKLYPAPVQNTLVDQTPICTLETWNLDAAQGKYEALSYAWGLQGHAPQQIECNQITTNIWPNLHLALTALRQKLSKGTVRKSKLIWVDALCINQDTDKAGMEERQKQILLMKDIFGFAAKVLIWLGSHDQASRQMWHSTQGVQPDSPMEQLRNAFQWGNLRMRQDFINRPWFHRVWTLQEACLSHKATLLCEEDELDWATFCTVWRKRYDFMKNLKPEYREPRTDHIDESLAFIGLINCFDMQTQMRGPEGERTFTLPLSEIIIRSWYRQATDLHDRIYALLGLIDITKYPGLEQVDYSKPLTEVFTEVTKIAMTVDQTPALLNIAGISSDGSQVANKESLEFKGSLINLRPSWVPDWSKKGAENTWLISRLASDDSKARISPSPESRHSWSVSSASWQPRFEDSRLHILGYFLGPIQKCRQPDSISKFELTPVTWYISGLRWVEKPKGDTSWNKKDWAVPSAGLPCYGETTKEGDVICAFEGIRSLFLVRLLFKWTEWDTYGWEWLKEDQQYNGLKLNCQLIGPVFVPGLDLAENPSLGYSNNYWDIILN